MEAWQQTGELSPAILTNLIDVVRACYFAGDVMAPTWLALLESLEAGLVPHPRADLDADIVLIAATLAFLDKQSASRFLAIREISSPAPIGIVGSSDEATAAIAGRRAVWATACAARPALASLGNVRLLQPPFTAALEAERDRERQRLLADAAVAAHEAEQS